MCVCVGERSCRARVKQLPSAALSCLTESHKNPISSQRGEHKEHERSGATQAHTTHNGFPVGRYDGEHLQSSMKPKSVKEERGGLLMYG